MSELQIFKNAEFGSVRTITVEGEPYFVGKDVAEILGYSNTRKALADHVDEVLANPDIIINALLELKAERERNANLQAVVAVQNQQMIEMQPKVSYYDVVINCKDLVAISVIAKETGFRSDGYFCRKFKEFYGVSPQTYRKEPSKKGNANIF